MPQPYSLEQTLMNLKTQALGYYQDGQNVDPLTVSRLLHINQTWPNLAPGASLSFARAGLTADNPIVKSAAQLAVKQTLSQKAWNDQLSSIHNISDIKNIPKEVVDSLTPTEAKQYHQKVQSTLEGALNGGGGLISDVAGGIGDIAGTVSDSIKQNVAGGGNFATGNLLPSAPANDIAKASVRTAGLALQTPVQYVQAKTRDIANSTGLIAHGDFSPLNPTSNINATTNEGDIRQTQGGQAAESALAGQPVDVGAGWLPDPNSATGQAAAASARAAAPTIGGHAFTFGRFVAQSAGYVPNSLFGTHIIQPGSNAFNVISGGVDAAVMVKSDPSASVLNTLGDARAAGKVFVPEDVAASNAATENTGLMPLASPPDVVQGTKSAWLNSKQGESVAARTVTEGAGSPSNIMRLYGPHNMPADLAVSLADQPDTNGIRQVLNDTTLPTKPQLGGFSYQVQKALDSRIATSMPTHTLVDLSDKDSTWTQLERTLQSANVPLDQRNAVLDQYLRSNNPIEAMDGVQSALKTQLLAHGASEDVASKATSVWRNGEDFSRSYDVDQATGLERARPGVIVNGEGYVFPNPTADSERLNSMVRLPNARTLRQLTSDWGPILNNPVVRNAEGFLDGITNTWKSLVVARPELLTKVTLEQQLNNAARGNINLFTHPLAFLSALAGGSMDSRFGQFLNRLPGIDPSYLFSPNGEPILEEGQNLLQRSLRYGGQDSDTLVTFGYHNAPITHPLAGDGLAEALGKMHTDPIFRGIANAESPEAAKEWFWSGDGQATRLARAPIVANDDAHNLAKVASGELGPNAQAITIGDIANDRAAADRYIDLSHTPRINDLTNGNQELLDAITTGKLGGHMLYQIPVAPEGSVVDQGAAAYAKNLLDSGQGPRNMIPVRDVAELPVKSPAFYNRMMDTVFHYMIDAPDAALNRSPAYRQAVWERSAQLLPYADPADLPKILKSAEESNLSDTLLTRLRNTRPDTSDTPRLSADDITRTAKATALGVDLPKTAHDLTSRTHMFDALRFIVPFGDAWRLILKRSAQLVMDEPQVIQRANAALYEAKQPGSSTINRLAGDPVDGNNGFFHTDPLTNEQVFTIPGSTLLTNSTFGVPIPLVGQVKGLSMLSDVYPGLGGPALTLPAKWLLPDTPTGNTIKDVIFPASSSQSEGIAADLGQQLVPSWFGKLAQAFPNNHTFNSAFNTAAQTLASTGNYDLNKPSDLQKLIHDAKQDAKWIYTVRGAAQFFVPGAPTDEALVKDKTGRWANASAAVKAYQQKSAQIGPDKAMKWLVNTLGVNNVLISQAASQPTAYAAPVTAQAQAWVDANPGVATKYPLVYGLFAPAHPGDKFDLKAYEEQFSKGERLSLSPEQQLAQAENRLGFYAYDRAKNQVVAQNGGLAPDSGQQQWLSAYRVQLQKSFPGFDTYLASPYDTTKRRASAIDQLITAARDPAIQSTDAGLGLQQYLDARSSAIAQAVAGGGKTPFQSKAGQELRFWLRTQAAQIIQDHPDFQPMWNDIFSREMVNN